MKGGRFEAAFTSEAASRAQCASRAEGTLQSKKALAFASAFSWCGYSYRIYTKALTNQRFAMVSNQFYL